MKLVEAAAGPSGRSASNASRSQSSAGHKQNITQDISTTFIYNWLASMWACVRLYLPLGLIHVLLQALQVCQEGLVELWQLRVLLNTRAELSDDTTSPNVSDAQDTECDVPGWDPSPVSPRWPQRPAVSAGSGQTIQIQWKLHPGLYFKSQISLLTARCDWIKVLTYSHGCLWWLGVLIWDVVHHQGKAVHGHVHPHWSPSCKKQTEPKIMKSQKWEWNFAFFYGKCQNKKRYGSL